MSTHLASRGLEPAGPALDVAGTPRVPFARLVRTELRKMSDTRAGRWLLGITVGVLVLLAYAGLLLLVDKPVLRDVLKNLRRGDGPNTERDSHEQ